MKKYCATLFSLFLTTCIYAQSTPKITIPQQGNTYVTACNDRNFTAGAAKTINTYDGRIAEWNDSKTTISLYFRTGRAGDFTLSVKATAGKANNRSTLRFSSGRKKYKVEIAGGKEQYYTVGTFRSDVAGYVKINIQGIERSGETFGNISEFTASGDAVAGENHFVPAEKTGECYWARRGPSVHMMYEMPNEDIEYFYNEVVVPKGNDIHGTYFMTTGFGEGYMGIQSIKDDKGNNANMVLFSVWSPYSTDNPDAIPDSLHVKVLSKGDGVTAQNFGNEGSGKQSFMHYPWKAGKTYRTLVKVQPDNNGNTIYTGYFGDEYGKWHLLSRMLRPATDTYYKGAHSFLECFVPETSIFTRKVMFRNQWTRDRQGNWHRIENATFTCDGTGQSGLRTDKKGGVCDNAFMLQNCGFFNESTGYGTRFTIETSEDNPPEIDFEALERMAADSNKTDIAQP